MNLNYRSQSLNFKYNKYIIFIEIFVYKIKIKLVLLITSYFFLQKISILCTKNKNIILFCFRKSIFIYKYIILLLYLIK